MESLNGAKPSGMPLDTERPSVTSIGEGCSCAKAATQDGYSQTHHGRHGRPSQNIRSVITGPAERSGAGPGDPWTPCAWMAGIASTLVRSEEHTSELQSRFGISYAVFCLKK